VITNDRMALRLSRLQVKGQRNGARLDPQLERLSAAEILLTEHGLVLKPLLPTVVVPSDYFDKTGFEALVNKIHVEDFLPNTVTEPDEVLAQGLAYAEKIGERLAHRSGQFKVFLCVDDDSNDVTCRFLTVREGEEWGSDDPASYPSESVAIWIINGSHP
jgi:hypothetical protein